MNREFSLPRKIWTGMTHTQIRDYLLRHRPTQVYIRIDLSKLTVTTSGIFKDTPCLITIFYQAPTLAQAVNRARQFCRRYYQGLPVLEYNVQ